MKIPLRKALFHSVPLALLALSIAVVRIGWVEGNGARVLVGFVMVVACFMILVQASVLGRMRCGARR